jgi:hypothetical protein
MLDVVSVMTMDMGSRDVLQSSQSAIKAAAVQVEKVYDLVPGTGMQRMGGQ